LQQNVQRFGTVTRQVLARPCWTLTALLQRRFGSDRRSSAFPRRPTADGEITVKVGLAAHGQTERAEQEQASPCARARRCRPGGTRHVGAVERCPSAQRAGVELSPEKEEKHQDGCEGKDEEDNKEPKPHVVASF